MRSEPCSNPLAEREDDASSPTVSVRKSFEASKQPPAVLIRHCHWAHVAVAVPQQPRDDTVNA